MSYDAKFAKAQVNNDGQNKKVKIGIGIIFLCLFLTVVFVSSYLYTKQTHFYRLYGEWEWCSTEVNETILQQWNSFDVGKEYDTGDVLLEKGDQIESIGKLSWLNKQAIDQFHLTITDGRMPKEADEIALDYESLFLLGLDSSIDREIRIPVTIQGVRLDKNFTLVGIIESYRYRWDITDKTTLPVAVYGGQEPLDKPQKLWIGKTEKSKIDRVSYIKHNEYAYGNHYWITRQDILVVSCMIGFGGVCFLVLYYFMRNSLMSHKKDLEVLKKLGATRKEMYHIKNWILWYLVRCYVPAAITLGALLTWTISMISNKFLITYRLTYLLIAFFICILSMVLAMHLPNRSADKKKRKGLRLPFRNTNPMTVGLRMLLTSFSNSILVILMTVLLLQVGFYALYQEKVVEKEYQDYLFQREQTGDYVITLYSHGGEQANYFSSSDIEGLKNLPYIQDFLGISEYQFDIQFPGAEDSEAVDVWKQQGNLQGTFLVFDDSDISEKYGEMILGFPLQKDTVVFFNNPFYYVKTEDLSRIDFIQSVEMAELYKKNGIDAYVVETKINHGSPITLEKGKQDITIRATNVIGDAKGIMNGPFENKPYTFIVNKQILSSFVDHEQVKYITMKAKDVNNPLIDKEIASIFSKYENVMIQNLRSKIADVHDKLLSTSTRLYMLTISTLVTWLLLMYKQSIAFMNHQRKTFHVLHRLGANKAFFQKIMLVECVLLMGIAFIIGTLVAFVIVPYISGERTTTEMIGFLDVVVQNRSYSLAMYGCIGLLFSRFMLFSYRKEMSHYGED